jgi:hypothetical protein
MDTPETDPSLPTSPTKEEPPPTPTDAFPVAHTVPRDPTRTRVVVLHDLSPASDSALLFALREIYQLKEGHGVDIIVVSVASDPVVKRTKPGVRQRTGSFRGFFSGQRRGSNSSVAKPPLEMEADEKMLDDACADFGIEREDVGEALLAAPTREEEAVGAVLEERLAKTVAQAGITWKVITGLLGRYWARLTRSVDSPQTPLSIVVLPHTSNTLHSLLQFFKASKPSLVVLASKGHTSGLVDTLVHQGIGKGVLMGWDGPVCMVRMSRYDAEGGSGAA